MKKNLWIAILLISSVGFAQNCSFGTVSENTQNATNMSTGGTYEYSSATDFDIEFGTVFTVEQVKFNVLKGAADLEYVNVKILSESGGMPGEIIHSFDQLIPTTQEFLSELDIEEMDLYQVTVDMPTAFDLAEGKYFLQINAAPGDAESPGWEITSQEVTSLGRFDFSKFDSDPWFGGFSYYDQVFEISGICTDTGEEQPDFGDECSHGNEGNDHETGFSLGGFNLADDFIVEENTIFTLTGFKMSTLQLGNIKNASIKIRKEENGMPGEVVYSVDQKGPETENYFGYWPLEGYPLDVVAVELEFELDEVVELEAGTYFLEIKATAFPFTDILVWEATSLPGIGGNMFWSADNGESWTEEPGYNLVFDVQGFCRGTLGVNDMEDSSFDFYPNPVRNELNITSKSDLRNISVYNLSGQLVMNSKFPSKKLDTSSLSAGIYMVKVELENGRNETFKIVKR